MLMQHIYAQYHAKHCSLPKRPDMQQVNTCIAYNVVGLKAYALCYVSIVGKINRPYT